MMVTYHGETVPETVPGSNPVIRYYTKGTSSITFNSSLPAGHYTITLSAVYNGRNYSTGFEVDILEVIDAENLTADLYAAFTEVSVSSSAGMIIEFSLSRPVRISSGFPFCLSVNLYVPIRFLLIIHDTIECATDRCHEACYSIQVLT